MANKIIIKYTGTEDLPQTLQNACQEIDANFISTSKTTLEIDIKDQIISQAQWGGFLAALDSNIQNNITIQTAARIRSSQNVTQSLNNYKLSKESLTSQANPNSEAKTSANSVKTENSNSDPSAHTPNPKTHRNYLVLQEKLDASVLRDLQSFIKEERNPQNSEAPPYRYQFTKDFKLENFPQVFSAIFQKEYQFEYRYKSQGSSYISRIEEDHTQTYQAQATKYLPELTKRYQELLTQDQEIERLETLRTSKSTKIDALKQSEVVLSNATTETQKKLSSLQTAHHGKTVKHFDNTSKVTRHQDELSRLETENGELQKKISTSNSELDQITQKKIIFSHT